MDVSKDGVCHPILAIQMRKDAERHDYPVVILTELWKINHPFYIVNFPWKMVIFDSYVSLPEGVLSIRGWDGHDRCPQKDVP
jgi:hypothetical protein